MRPALPLLLVLACTPTPGDDSGDTTSTTSSSTSTVGTTSPDPTTGDVPTSTTTTADATTADATTADPADTTTGSGGYCWGWEGADGEPFLDLHDRDDNLLTNGSKLPLECGGQGLFMFGLHPRFGGFVPDGEILDFDLVVDVDGFNDNPEGHFYSAHPVGYYVGCDDVIGGVLGVLPVFPLDNLDDLGALDGEPAKIQVTLPTGGEPIVTTLDVVLSVTPDDSWDFCGG